MQLTSLHCRYRIRVAHAINNRRQCCRSCCKRKVTRWEQISPLIGFMLCLWVSPCCGQQPSPSGQPLQHVGQSCDATAPCVQGASCLPEGGGGSVCKCNASLSLPLYDNSRCVDTGNGFFVTNQRCESNSDCYALSENPVDCAAVNKTHNLCVCRQSEGESTYISLDRSVCMRRSQNGGHALSYVQCQLDTNCSGRLDPEFQCFQTTGHDVRFCGCRSPVIKLLPEKIIEVSCNTSSRPVTTVLCTEDGSRQCEREGIQAADCVLSGKKDEQDVFNCMCGLSTILSEDGSQCVKVTTTTASNTRTRSLATASSRIRSSTSSPGSRLKFSSLWDPSLTANAASTSDAASSSLGAGLIAGLTLAAVFVLAVAGGGVFFCTRKPHRVAPGYSAGARKGGSDSATENMFTTFRGVSRPAVHTDEC